MIVLPALPAYAAMAMSRCRVNHVGGLDALPLPTALFQRQLAAHCLRVLVSMTKLEAFYNFTQDVSAVEADLGLLQLMNEMRVPQGLSYSREQSNSEGMMWPESANYDRPAQLSGAHDRSTRPALDQGLDDWIEQGLRDSFAESALHHMRFVVEENVEFAEECRRHFLHNSHISTMSSLRRVPFPHELGLHDVLGKPTVSLAVSRKSAPPISNDFAASISDGSLHTAFYNYIKSLSHPGGDKVSSILQLVHNLRNPHAWVCSPPTPEIPGSFRALPFEHLAEIMPASFRGAACRALLPLRRFYPSAGQPCVVRVVQAYEPGPADGNHLRLQVGDHVLVDSQVLDLPGFSLGRLVSQPHSALQVFPTAHTKLVREVAHFAVTASEASAAISLQAGISPFQNYLHGIEVSNRLLSASITRLSLLYTHRKTTGLGSSRLDGRSAEQIPLYLALRGHNNFNDFSSILVSFLSFFIVLNAAAVIFMTFVAGHESCS